MESAVSVPSQDKIYFWGGLKYDYNAAFLNRLIFNTLLKIQE